MRLGTEPARAPSGGTAAGSADGNTGLRPAGVPAEPQPSAAAPVVPVAAASAQPASHAVPSVPAVPVPATGPRPVPAFSATAGNLWSDDGPSADIQDAGLAAADPVPPEAQDPVLTIPTAVAALSDAFLAGLAVEAQRAAAASDIPGAHVLPALPSARGALAPGVPGADGQLAPSSQDAERALDQAKETEQSARAADRRPCGPSLISELTNRQPGLAPEPQADLQTTQLPAALELNSDQGSGIAPQPRSRSRSPFRGGRTAAQTGLFPPIAEVLPSPDLSPSRRRPHRPPPPAQRL